MYLLKTVPPFGVTPVITELTDVFPKDITPNPPEVTPIVIEFAAVFSEDIPDKLPLTHDIQHVIELISWVNFSELTHPRLDPTKQTELKGQVKFSLHVSNNVLS